MKYLLLICLLLVSFSVSANQSDNIDKVDGLTGEVSDMNVDDLIEEESFGDTTNPIESFRESQFEAIAPLLQSNGNGARLDTQKAQDRLNELNSSFEHVISDIESVQARKDRIQSRYEDIRNGIINIIRTSRETKHNIKQRISAVRELTYRINKLEKRVDFLRNEIGQTKEELASNISVLYRINNDYYGSSGQIDSIRLLANTDNIASSLSSEDVMKSMMYHTDDLMELLGDRKKAYEETVGRYNDYRTRYRKEVQNYKGKIEEYEQQKENLKKIVDFLQEDREYTQEEFQDLVDQKEAVKNRISLIKNYESSMSNEALSVSGVDLSKLYENSERPDEGNFFSWPVLPVERFSAFFEDDDYKEVHGTDHNAIDVVVEQGTEVYAPANGVVYKVVNQDGPGLNWFVMAHKHGYITVYLHMQDIFVQKGDYVDRGELIGLTGGTPGTRGAGLLSSGPHLHFEVIQDGEYIDPLEVLDLSVVKDRRALPKEYQVKYMEDRLSRSYDMSGISYASGDTVEERRKDYLARNAIGPYSDVELWEAASQGTDVDIDFGICIAAAESGLGRNMTTEWNVGNVGNNDRGDRIGYDTPAQGARMIYLTLVNSFLGHHNTIDKLSRWGNKDGSIYASSPKNWQKNVSRCLSSIKGYWVPEDYPFRKATQMDDIAAR
ncbi:murein hydrolase activator EnvC family protein [Candidatus Absconditicoccus praedator]|uniref:murein hydrolase activator EnvC family protein n=1 Tax=Candidatus Absconditicoccus praedator TaxID=2735562 RepID=UPI001E32D9E0|nr:M23 family metallopeptidase [Candidatus Absconditicoccus praedator]UFX83280.1 peptidoglycan DD-metalloendopeptidase family protein [Candidatus Absconditicoccus praedator]